ncbi:MAG: peptidylprolyl isomerase [Bacteroidota bacterium]
MIHRLTLWTICLCIGSLTVYAQDDPVLFTVEKTPVKRSEFTYIYSKTNGDKADFSRESLREYLDLYVKFKLKVQRARDMQLDTIQSLQNELEGYRKQLANSYLVDKEVTERLVKEAYDRTQSDVDISHIMIALPETSSPEDTLKAYERAMSLRKMMASGQQSFEDNASKLSDDKATKSRKGRIGFITALLPDGFYAFESAAYTTKKGDISLPVRTPLGYHLVKVNDVRPARGQMEAAHIFLRIDKKKGMTSEATKKRIDDIYAALQRGDSFEDLAKAQSDDKKTADRGGVIGFFGINRYEKAFEDAAFALAKDGDFSQPVKTKAGWHIIKRISNKGIESYDIAKRRLQTKIQNDSRYALAKQVMVNRIKKENNYQEETAFLDDYLQKLDANFLTYKWKPSNEAAQRIKPLFTMGATKKTLGEFEAYMQRASRQRLRAGRNAKAPEVGRQLFNGFVEESAIRFEEGQLEKKYPEFKALMREYREGILLFEATKNLVWDKASQDTTGLKKFHEANKNKYMWGERAEISNYTIKAEGGEKLASKARKCAKKKGSEAVLKDLGKRKEFVAVQEKIVEKDKDPLIEGMSWKKGSLSPLKTNASTKAMRFVKIEQIMPASPKTLDEARGYIIADYQDHLEKQWVESLQKDYKVNIDEKVFDGMVK